MCPYVPIFSHIYPQDLSTAENLTPVGCSWTRRGGTESSEQTDPAAGQGMRYEVRVHRDLVTWW